MTYGRVKTLSTHARVSNASQATRTQLAVDVHIRLPDLVALREPEVRHEHEHEHLDLYDGELDADARLRGHTRAHAQFR